MKIEIDQLENWSSIGITFYTDGDKLQSAVKSNFVKATWVGSSEFNYSDFIQCQIDLLPEFYIVFYCIYLTM